MSQGDDGAVGTSTAAGGGGAGAAAGERDRERMPGNGATIGRERARTTGETATSTTTTTTGGATTTLTSLIRQRQDAAGSTQVLDLSYANLDVFPTEIEFLREVLEKLTISHNSIRTLPLQLNMFTSLRYLNIRANSIRIFPAVLCHLSSLEILDMSRNKISRFPDSFGNLMHLRVLSISKNRIDVIPTYIGDMPHLQFLKIEQNPIVFPPSEVVDNSGQDMESWLRRLKAYLVSQQGTNDTHANERVQVEDTTLIPPGVTAQERTHLAQRTTRSSSSDSLVIPPTHRQSRSEPGLRLSIPITNDRSGSQPTTLSPAPTTHKPTRVNSQHATHNDDHYRFISHSRGVSGDSTSSLGSTVSNDGDKYSDVYFQRLTAHPLLSSPLPPEKARLVEAARGILFALSQIYRAIKQCVGCVTDEKLVLLFTRLLQSTSSSMTQLIQALERFDSMAHSQIPDQIICAEILRCCESNVAAFRKLVNMVQAQIRAISMAADARLVRNLVLQLHGALSEIRLAWDALVPLIQAAAGESSTALVDPKHPSSHQQQQQVLQHSAVLSSYAQQSHHSLHQQQQPHPFQVSPTMQATPTWHPIQIPHRSQNMSRASNHSNQSMTHVHQDEDDDGQLLLTVEHAIEAARRLIQSLTETCMTRFDSHLTMTTTLTTMGSRTGTGTGTSPQLRPTHRNRSVSASPPRSSGSSGSSTHSSGQGIGSNVSQASSGSLKRAGGGPDHSQQEQVRGLTMSPLQLSADTTAGSSNPPSSTATNATSTSDSSTNSSTLIRSPLFSNSADSVPYSNGMCLSLPLDQKAPSTTSTKATASNSSPSGSASTKKASTAMSTVATSETSSNLSPNSNTIANANANTHTDTSVNAGSIPSAGQNEALVPRTERRSTTGLHSKGSSRASYDPALPSIPQNETPISSLGAAQTTAGSATTGPGGMVVTSRSASVSVTSSAGGYVPTNHSTLSSSSLPTPGFHSSYANSLFQSTHPPHLQPGTPGQYSSSPVHYPIGTNNTLNLPASQLWREMRDCLLQMTEIVKRLDFDLTMIRTEDHGSNNNNNNNSSSNSQASHHHPNQHYQHPHHPHHTLTAGHHPPSNHSQQQPHQQLQTPTQGHVPHALQSHQHHNQNNGQNNNAQQQQQQHLVHHQGRDGTYPYHPIYSGPGSESDSNALRRRFGMGISDFVKSVVVISTLVRQLASTGGQTRSGSFIPPMGSTAVVESGDISSNTPQSTTMTSTSSSTTTTTTTTTTISSTIVSNPLKVGGSHESTTTPTTTTHGNNLTSTEQTPSPEPKVSPTTTMSTLSSSTGAGLTGRVGGVGMGGSGGSPEKARQPFPSQHPVTRHQSQPALFSTGSASGSTSGSALAQQHHHHHHHHQHPSMPPPIQQQHHHQQQTSSTPDIFSRLVTTNVSNLTKITKELTMRMPRSSFRDLMLPQSSPS
ncbi:RAM signaling network component, partial [Podila humilis]